MKIVHFQDHMALIVFGRFSLFYFTCSRPRVLYTVFNLHSAHRIATLHTRRSQGSKRRGNVQYTVSGLLHPPAIQYEHRKVVFC